MSVCLSETDIAYLQCLKESGIHERRHLHANCAVDVLSHMFAEYCRLKGDISAFNRTWFSSDTQSVYRDINLFLTSGERGGVTRYCNERGWLDRLSKNRWRWSKL